MSPHGLPDWGLTGPKHVTYGLDDLGEHAVRMGSPHLWDRRGDVIYASDFRDGLAMFHTGAWGLGAQVDLVTGFSRQGAYSVRLRAGSNGQQRAYLQLACPFQDPSNVGLEFSFSVEPNTEKVRAQIEWWDGATSYMAWCRYMHVVKDIDCWVHPGVGHIIDPNVSRHECVRPEHTMKLVVDMAANEYVRFMIDDLSYNLGGLEARRAGAIFPPYWVFTVQQEGVALTNPDIYVDNVIVTQNEPS